MTASIWSPQFSSYPFRAYSIAEARFGYVIGSANNQTAIQTAIGAAANDGVSLYIPGDVGIHFAEQLNIPTNLHIFGTDSSKSILKQVGGTNANFVTIPYDIIQNPILENFTIDGNRFGGNSSGNGLHLTDHIVPSSTTYGFSVVLRNMYIQNCADDCMYVGFNRNIGHVDNTEFKRGDRCVYITGSSDWRFFHGRFAFPLAAQAIYVESGADNIFLGGSAYGALTAECVRLAGISNSPTKLIGMTINFNQREGLWITGLTGTARGIAHVIQGCWFEGNSLETNNTYSDIKVTDIRDVIFSGNTFRWAGTGNQSRYLVEFTGVTAPCEWTGNSYSRSTLPYGTALTNTPNNLSSYIETLRVGGAVFGDIADYGNYANDAAAAAGGVAIGRYYRNGSVLMIRVS